MAGPSFEVIQFILYLIYIFWETVKMNFIIICLYLNEIFILAESQLFNIFVWRSLLIWIVVNRDILAIDF